MSASTVSKPVVAALVVLLSLAAAIALIVGWVISGAVVGPELPWAVLPWA